MKELFPECSLRGVSISVGLVHETVLLERLMRKWKFKGRDRSLPGSSVHGILQARMLE